VVRWRIDALINALMSHGVFSCGMNFKNDVIISMAGYSGSGFFDAFDCLEETYKKIETF
jgi:hypothetical protein